MTENYYTLLQHDDSDSPHSGTLLYQHIAVTKSYNTRCLDNKVIFIFGDYSNIILVQYSIELIALCYQH